MKQELKDCIEELSEVFDYIAKKSSLDVNTHHHKYYFISSIVSSLYLEAFKQSNVQYEIGIKNDKP